MLPSAIGADSVHRVGGIGDDGTGQVTQGALFNDFNLEAFVPEDHLLRSINRFVDLSGVRVHSVESYSSPGRPSNDPELMRDAGSYRIFLFFAARQRMLACARGDKSKRTDGTFSQEDFSYDRDTGTYICPAGKELRHGRRMYRVERVGLKDTTSAKYSALKADCEVCPLKMKCRLKGAPRKVARSGFESARQMARDIAETVDIAVSCKLRQKVGIPLTHLKRLLGLGRLRLRESCGANDEFLFAATAQNLRKLAKLIPMREAPKPA